MSYCQLHAYQVWWNSEETSWKVWLNWNGMTLDPFPSHMNLSIIVERESRVMGPAGRLDYIIGMISWAQSARASRAAPYYVTMAIQSEHAHFITKWRTTCNKVIQCSQQVFRSYFGRITKLKCYCTARYKKESVYTKVWLKGQGSLELVDEAQKERFSDNWPFYVWFMHV